MEREACRAEMLPIFACNGLPNAMALPRNILEASSRVVQISPRFSPGARPWRRLGYPNRQCGLGGATCLDFYLRSRAAPRSGSRHRRRAQGPLATGPGWSESTCARLLRRGSQNPTTGDFCSMLRAVALTTGRYSHNTAILGAIDSIHWLHDWRNSSLVAAVALGDALWSAVCNHAAATPACGSVALAEAL